MEEIMVKEKCYVKGEEHIMEKNARDGKDRSSGGMNSSN